MDEINKTLFIPLYGKARVSEKNVILHDEKAETIWAKEAFPIHGKAKSKWLAYYMAMRARVFDDWTKRTLQKCEKALVLQIGCGLDGRCLRVRSDGQWIDADMADVIRLRRNYYEETPQYHMEAVDASKEEELMKLPSAAEAVVLLEGVSMYLTNGELRALLRLLQDKYESVHLLMDIYTEWAAKASKYKNPVNEMGVWKLYGVADMERLAEGTGMRVKTEHSMTPKELVRELEGFERVFFKVVFAGKMAKKLYRLYELESGSRD